MHSEFRAIYLHLQGCEGCIRICWVRQKNVKDGSGSVYQFLRFFVNLGARQVNRCTVDSFNQDVRALSK